jgi:hypothetical protein
VPTRTTPRSVPRGAAPATVVAGALLYLLGAAGPALAVNDLSRPDAQVTHGPSCHPGGMVVEVTAGTAPYAVRLATTRMPEGEDEAVLDPGQTVVLETGDVDWGETIDSRLEYTALDGSGTAYVDELEDYSFTRPTEEDCAAIAPAPLPAAPATPGPSVPTALSTVEPVPGSVAVPSAQPAGDVGLPAADGDGPAAPVVDPRPPVAADGGAPAESPVAAPGPPPLAGQVTPAAETRSRTSWPVFFAGLSLLGSATGWVLLGAAGGRRRAARSGLADSVPGQ